MNYIELINWFWICDEVWEFTATETRLYMYLLKVANALSWQQNPFWHSDGKTGIGARCSINSMKTARNRLVQAELINVESGGKGYGNKSRYQILTPKPYPNLIPKHEPKPVPKHEPLNKQNKTKQEKPLLSPVGDGNIKFDFIDSIIQEFTQSYLAYKKVPYELVNPGKERKAAGKILNLHKKKFPGYSSDESLKALRNYFDLCNQVKDTWLSDNMSLSTIINKFNEINNKLRNGNKRATGEPATSDTELAGIFAKHFATDYPGK